METRIVNIQEAKTQLSRLLRHVEAGGEVLIARAGTTIARIVREVPERPRRWGIYAGQGQVDADAFAPMHMPDDWEAPLDP